MTDRDGPYIGFAVICEKALQETDGVLSLIRIIDRITITARGPDAPDNLPMNRLDFFVAISLRSGKARGRHTLRVNLEMPSGEFVQGQDTPVHLEGEDRGINVVAPTAVQANQEGLYWFHVLLNRNQLLTKIPLRVQYAPIR